MTETWIFGVDNYYKLVRLTDEVQQAHFAVMLLIMNVALWLHSFSLDLDQTRWSTLVLRISKLELFEISKFRNILMTIFKCRIFSAFRHFAGENKDCYFDMYVQIYAYFKLNEQELNLLQLLHTCKLKNIFITC